MERTTLQGAVALGTALLVAVPAAAGPISQTSPGALAGCRPAPCAGAGDGSGAFQIGVATWYGREFHGQNTASGEAFDMFRLTAAHRDLPLGSYVRVSNLRNGKWVVVRINDRGPRPRSAIIDLSYAAAELLGMMHKGRATVRLDPVRVPDLRDRVARN